MQVRVLYHDNCFDGAASAALFSEFYRVCIEGDSAFEYIGMQHGPGNVFAGSFSPVAKEPSSGWGEAPRRKLIEHACVDFRYSPDARLDWWFDHHQSAFVTPEDELHFRQAHNPRHFYDPHAQSCCKFLTRKAAEVYGFDAAPYRELIEWADLIDGAKFASPAQAVECKEPALQLMQWVEHNRDPELKLRFIADLRSCGLTEIAGRDYVQRGIAPLLAQRDAQIALLRERARIEDGVVFYDLLDQPPGPVSKFAPYYLFPEAHYVVGLSMLPGRAKISVGSNPWHGERRTANIASLCGQYGGGGHPAVGAVSLSSAEADRVRVIGGEMLAVLRAAARNERG
jgi:hypothetical protein